jgi:hypothetical protein
MLQQSSTFGGRQAIYILSNSFDSNQKIWSAIFLKGTLEALQSMGDFQRKSIWKYAGHPNQKRLWCFRSSCPRIFWIGRRLSKLCDNLVIVHGISSVQKALAILKKSDDVVVLSSPDKGKRERKSINEAGFKLEFKQVEIWMRKVREWLRISRKTIGLKSDYSISTLGGEV